MSAPLLEGKSLPLSQGPPHAGLSGAFSTRGHGKWREASAALWRARTRALGLATIRISTGRRLRTHIKKKSDREMRSPATALQPSRRKDETKWACYAVCQGGAVPLLVAIMTTRQRITFAEPRLVGSRWEPCLGTGVPVLVAWDAPQFSLDVAGNVVPVRGGGRPLSSVSATQRRNRSPYLVTAPSDQSLSPLSASLCTSHKDGAMPSPRKRRLVPRALLPSPVSVRHTSAMPAAMLAPSTACDHDREDALGVVLKLAEAVHCMHPAQPCSHCMRPAQPYIACRRALPHRGAVACAVLACNLHPVARCLAAHGRLQSVAAHCASHTSRTALWSLVCHRALPTRCRTAQP